MNRILVVEDSPTTQALIRASLEKIAHVKCVGSIKDGEQELNRNNYDLLVLDVVLPDGDGFSLCERLRTKPEFADLLLIFLTDQAELDNKVKGLKLGGDDFLAKPFSPLELQARVNARLRRKSATPNSTLKVNGFRVDFNTQTVYLQTAEQEEKNLDLTRIEFKLLVFFLRNIEKIFSRSDLLQKIWGEGTHVSEHTVDTHISSLRKKIIMSGYQVKSVVKQGYKLESAPKK